LYTNYDKGTVRPTAHGDRLFDVTSPTGTSRRKEMNIDENSAGKRKDLNESLTESVDGNTCHVQVAMVCKERQQQFEVQLPSSIDSSAIPSIRPSHLPSDSCFDTPFFPLYKFLVRPKETAEDIFTNSFPSSMLCLLKWLMPLVVLILILVTSPHRRLTWKIL